MGWSSERMKSRKCDCGGMIVWYNAGMPKEYWSFICETCSGYGFQKDEVNE